LNAVCEGKLIVEKIKICSAQGDYLSINYDEEFDAAFNISSEFYKITKDNPWWDRSDPAAGDWFEIGKKEVKFHFQKVSWQKELLWEEENKNAKSNKPTWNPKIINGGKETKH
jgi:hypothetical protein